MFKRKLYQDLLLWKISMQVKYEYENTKSRFKFTFYRPLGQKYVQDQMTKAETKVLSAIKKNNYARISEIA